MMIKIKEILDKIKNSGFTAFLAGVIGVLLFLAGDMFASGIAFGFFVKANWDLISNWIDEKTGIKI